jgi:hypothetical protein
MSRRRRKQKSGEASSVEVATAPDRSATSRRRTAAWIFLGLTVLYFCNFRLTGSGDSLPTRVLPFSILREGNLDLNEFTWAKTPRRAWPYYIHGQGPAENRRFFSVSSIATAIVVTPLYVLPTAWLAWNDIPYVDARARAVTVLMEKLCAAMLTALSASVLFLALCRLTTERWALALTLIYALGTSTWSISSQALWAHALSELCLALLLVVLASDGTGHKRLIAAGLVCVLMVWNRPQMAIFAAMAFFYFVSINRRIVIPLVLSALAGGGLLIGYNLWALGNVFGGYGSFDHFSNPFFSGLAGLTVSPNRGLFIYTPIALFSLIGAVEVWRGAAPRWIRVLTIGLFLHVVMYSKFDDWWAGFSYGPRYFTDVQPLLVVLMVYGLIPLWRFQATRVIAAVFAAWGIAVQAVGVYAADDSWNRDPISVDVKTERVWDWNDTQIGRSLGNGFRGFELLPVLVDVFADSVPARVVELRSEDLASRVRLLDMPTRMTRGRSTSIRVRLTNLGGVSWPAFSGKELLDIRNLVFLVQSWQVRGEQIPGLGEVQLLPENLAPGETIEVTMPLVAPPFPGMFDVQFRVSQAVDGERGIPSPDSAMARLLVQ